ncbi:MAG: DUF2541 family protein [Saprospiraceae bacterium]
MKKLSKFHLYSFVFLLVASVFSISASLPFQAESDGPGRWERLGTKKVNFGLDRDEIVVSAREGLFTAMKLKVKRAGINMHKCVVHFANGESQEIIIRNNLRQGGETRVIDINGGARVIRKVVFWYDTKNIRARKGVIELWGRH